MSSSTKTLSPFQRHLRFFALPPTTPSIRYPARSSSVAPAATASSSAASSAISPAGPQTSLASRTPTKEPTTESSRHRITLLSALRAALSLGLNFPVALMMAIGIRLRYPSVVEDVQESAWSVQLDEVDDVSPSTFHSFEGAGGGNEYTNGQRSTPLPSDPPLTRLAYSRLPPSLSRSDLFSLLYLTPAFQSRSLLQRTQDWLHTLSLWCIAADPRDRLVALSDAHAWTRGKLGEAIAEKRRRRTKGRGNVIPAWRGGPIWVAGHSWAVRLLFGVEVYM